MYASFISGTWITYAYNMLMMYVLYIDVHKS